VEQALSFRPLVPGECEAGHGRTLPLRGALTPPVGAPAFLYPAHDFLGELVTWPGEGEGGVGVKTLEVLTAARAGDPYRKLGPEAPLLGIGALEARASRARLPVLLC